MNAPHQAVVDKFFEAYGKRDLNGIRQVMAENVTWSFLGRHPLAGVKKGINEVVALFDAVGKTMSESTPKIEKLIVSENDRYLIECVHTQTQRRDGINLDHYASVLWTFENGKIIEGKHFFSDPEAVNRYFAKTAIM
jgi:ketosteroid isomerase-like protein